LDSILLAILRISAKHTAALSTNDLADTSKSKEQAGTTNDSLLLKYSWTGQCRPSCGYRPIVTVQVTYELPTAGNPLIFGTSIAIMFPHFCKNSMYV